MSLDSLTRGEIKHEQEVIASEQDWLDNHLPNRRDLTAKMREEIAEDTRTKIRRATERVTALTNGTYKLVKLTPQQAKLLWELPVRNGTHWTISSKKWLEFAPAQLKNWERIMEAAMVLGFRARVCASLLNKLKKVTER